MKRLSKTAGLFLFMAIYGVASIIYEAITWQVIIIPIYHTGYFTIIPRDYILAVLLEVGGSLFFFHSAYEDIEVVRRG